MNSTQRWFGALAVAPMVFAAGVVHAEGQKTHRPICDALKVRPGDMRCYSHVVTNPDGSVHVEAAPQGYGPSDLASAYGIPASGPGDGKIVALVDAMDSPDVEQDLATYRSTYGLPACTTANGCFIKLNQDGVVGSYPTADTGWAGEIALDVEMVSAVCPTCKVMLVEANSASTDDLGAALLTAIGKGAVAVSNSYGGPETSGKGDVAGDTQYFASHAGILITASAGDNGYGASYPATSTYVLAIGGTSLVQDSSARGWSETAWTSTGSGCSAEFARPAWQSALPTTCKDRMESDVSASADPQNAVAVYCSDTDCGSGEGGWIQVGGTSESSPIIASLFTLLGLTTLPTSWVYSNTDKFYDVTSGSNGSCSTKDKYYCTAGAGYDGPTGWGSPNAPLLAQGGTQVNVDAGSDDSGAAGDSGSGDGGATNDDGGTTTTPDGGSPTNEDSGTTVIQDSGTINVNPTGDDGGATTTPVDGGSGGFSNGSGSSSGCSCNAPGTSSPLGETGVSLLALGAVALLASRRRRS